MPLTYAQIEAGLKWGFTKTNTGFGDTTQQGELNANISYSVTDVTKSAGAVYSISASATQTVDLQTMTDWASTALSSGKAVAFGIKVTGNGVTVKAGSTNGLTTWFIRNSGQLYLPAGSFFVVGWPYSAAATVSGSAKTLDIVNDSGATATVTIAFLGGA